MRHLNFSIFNTKVNLNGAYIRVGSNGTGQKIFLYEVRNYNNNYTSDFLL